MLPDKGLIGALFALFSAGLCGTLAVLLHVLPAPQLTPPNSSMSAFYNAFVAKDQLLIVYQWVRFHAFRTAPPSTVLGQNGWLYYRSEAVGDGDSINDFMGRLVPDSVTLTRWRQTLVERRKLMDERDIHYLAFVAPNTMSIYPENLPTEILLKRGRTRLDAVMDFMQDEIIDLRPYLLKSKQTEIVYDSGDTHWNDFGAFTGYETVTSEINKWYHEINPIHRADLLTWESMRNREIEHMIGQWQWQPRPAKYLDAKKTFGARCAETGEFVLAPGSLRESKKVNARFRDWIWGLWGESLCPSRRFIQDNPALPKAVVFYDSFMIALNPFLSQNFREVRYIRSRFDPLIVDQEKPDIVIDEVTERYLNQLF